MGAWGYKVFDNDQVLDCIGFIENTNKVTLPFVTYQLLRSVDEYENLLGVIIVSACKTKLSNRADLLSETCYGNDYKGLFSKIYRWATTDKYFNELMFHWCEGYTYRVLDKLKQGVYRWRPEIQKDRMKYLDELMEINNTGLLSMYKED